MGLSSFCVFDLKYLLPLLLVVAVVYWPGLAGGFIFDDRPNIVANSALRLFDGSLSTLLEASEGGLSSPLGRPLSLASFAANIFLFGESPFYFKLVNLLIHLAAGVLVYVLVKQIWRGLIADGREAWASRWIAALWLLHPINLTPVLFVVQRMTGLSALFTLAALCLYLRGRRSSGWQRRLSLAMAMLVCWPAGILSKESALLLPLFILLCEWLVLDGFRSWPPKLRLIGCMALSGALLGVLAVFWPLIAFTYEARDFSLVERQLTEARVLWLYIVQILLPLPELFSLHHDDIALSRGLFDPPATIVALLAWLVVVGIAFHQRRQRPWITFSVFWFLAGHALESSLIGLEIAHEHRNYLPSLGIILGLAGLLLPLRAAETGGVPRLALAIAFIVFCGVVTGLRAAQWGDHYVRTQIEANTHPQSARTHFEAAWAILERQLPTGQMNAPAYFMARIHFQRAAQYDPHNKAALSGILYLDCAYGTQKDTQVRGELLRRLANEPFAYGEQGFIQNLSNLLVYGLMCLDRQESEALLTAALSNATARGRIRGMLHAVAMDYAFAKLGDRHLARRHAEAAVESDPRNAILHINLIRVLLQLGDLEGARRQYAVLTRLKILAANRKEVEILAMQLNGQKNE